MEDLNNIVDILILQHRNLQKDLGIAVDLLHGDKFEEIDASLRKFTADLQEHLQLENNVFYFELLKKMKEHGVDTGSTEKFIAEMNVIGNAVMSFLGKYDSAESIKNLLSDFKIELPDIITALNLRIESEESGVYSYWELYK